MRIKDLTPAELAMDLLGRSQCSVQVTAVLADNHGIAAWGWNSSGLGYGLCAERHCLSRANRRRLGGATMWVVGRRKKSKNYVNARPCDVCMKALVKVKKVMWFDGEGWQEL